MTPQTILDSVAVLCGINTTTFKTTTLFPLLKFILAELAQEGAIDALKESDAFSLTAGVRQYDTATLCGLSAGVYPSTIYDITCYAYGLYDQPVRCNEREFKDERLLTGLDTTGDKITHWTIYPNRRYLVVHPVPTDAAADDSAGLWRVEFSMPPTVPAIDAELAEIEFEDLPTIYAGFLIHGVKFQDETMQDKQEALYNWQRGVDRMKARIVDYQSEGRPVRMRYRNF